MKKLLFRIKQSYLFVYLYIVTLFRRVFPIRKKSTDDLNWEAHEMARKKELRKKHFFIWLFEKFEPLIMVTGFVAFIVDPFVEIFFQKWVHWVLRAWVGLAMGLGFASWLWLPFQKKWTFYWQNETKSLLTKLNDILDKFELRPLRERQVN